MESQHSREGRNHTRTSRSTSIPVETRRRFAIAVTAAGGAKAAAKKIGCSRSHVEMIIAGKRDPGLHMAWQIKCAFGIPFRAWIVDAVCS